MQMSSQGGVFLWEKALLSGRNDCLQGDTVSKDSICVTMDYFLGLPRFLCSDL